MLCLSACLPVLLPFWRAPFQRLGLDSGYTADLRFTQHREALRWAADARLDGGYRRGEQMMRASRDSLEEAIKVAVVCLGGDHPKTRALVACLRRFSPFA